MAKHAGPADLLNKSRKLCEWVLGRGTLPEAVFGDPRLREDGGDDDSASRMNLERQHPKPDHRVAQRADTAEGCASAIHTTRGGNDGNAIRIRARALPAAALPLGLAAGHVRRCLAERPRGNGRQGREREHQSETRSHKAASPAKIAFRSEHPYWAKYSMFGDGATSFFRGLRKSRKRASGHFDGSLQIVNQVVRVVSRKAVREFGKIHADAAFVVRLAPDCPEGEVSELCAIVTVS